MLNIDPDPPGNYDATATYDRGAGWSVAILDTGVEKTHSFLSRRVGGRVVSRVVSEACYSNGGLAEHTSHTSLCPGAVNQSTKVGSGVPCTVAIQCNHGTVVAGVAVGDGATSDGVAPASTIVSIQVYTQLGGPPGPPIWGLKVRYYCGDESRTGPA